MLLNGYVETERETTREVDPTDAWDNGCTGIASHHTYVIAASNHGTELSVKSGDTVYVLVEHYGDGCTFGNDEYMEVRGVFLSEEDAMKEIPHTTPDHGYFGWHINWLVEPAVVP